MEDLLGFFGYTNIEVLDYDDEPLLIKCNDELGDECILMLVAHTVGKNDNRYIKFTPNGGLPKFINGEIDLLNLINESANYQVLYGKSIKSVDKIPNKYLPDEGYYI